ncbi:MAG: DUF3014 domain-containing protein [Gammaproteobacteria bacterium]|nr:DUF3014 domain-containing protein [Gammaproteobacteria bacterium]
MKSFLIIVFILVITGVGAYYYLQIEEAKDQASQSVKTEPLQLPEDATPDIRHPIPESPMIFDSDADKSAEEMAAVAKIEEPLPSLEESDNKIKEILAEIFGDNLVNQIFTQTGLIHRFVVTIDTLPDKKLSNKFRLILPAPGKFLVQKDSGDKITVDPDNVTRYSTYIQLLNMLETEQFVKWYTHFYPLIQEAYDALGYKDRYFNDRFIFVIDHLLEAPEVIGPAQLVRPKVFYEYADPALERLSAGQKILLRIGPENTAIVKAKLAEIRKKLAAPPLE